MPKKEAKASSKSASKTSAKPVKAAKNEKAKAEKKEKPKISAKPAAKTAAKVSAAPAPATLKSKAKAPAKRAELKGDLEVDAIESSDTDEEVAPKAAKAPKAEKVPKVKKPKKSEVLALALLTEETRKWNDYKQKYGSDKATPYSMSQVFENHTTLKHDKLGWGYIVNIQNDRLEVLFETGTKILISNYKPA